MKGHLGCLRSQITAGAEVNSTNDRGFTAMIYAAKYGHNQCLQLLIQAGCDVNHATI